VFSLAAAARSLRKIPRRRVHAIPFFAPWGHHQGLTMRLITYTSGPAGAPRIGVRVGHRVLDIEAASRVDGLPLPASMKALLRQGRGALSRVQALAKAAQASAGRFSSAMVEERAIRFMPPVADAGRFVRIADNFAANGEVKSPSAVALDCARLSGHNAKASGAARSSYPEAVFVIGRRVLQADGDDALDHVLGVTILGAAGAVGPEIVTMDEVDDPDDLWITCSVNGQEHMRFNTRDLRWNLAEALTQASRDEALEPGDMVATGAPDGQRPLKTGDVVECAIEGLATLRVVLAPVDLA
jgi:2-keto-4-pentenoate hydratase/2-oxohepta-3-ene-1,7-dioic acid hydratase in catechol pathway